MATITVTCPTCACQLEIDAQYRNQEVECGSCNQIFVAKPARAEREERDEPRPSKRREKPRSRRSNRYEDDEDDFEEYEERRQRRRRTQEGTGLGDASLIMGILAIFVFWCPIIGGPLTVVGVVLGALGIKATNNGTAIAGLILNILFLIVTLVFLVFYVR